LLRSLQHQINCKPSAETDLALQLPLHWYYYCCNITITAALALSPRLVLALQHCGEKQAESQKVEREKK
jgi:hypothetical protein